MKDLFKQIVQKKLSSTNPATVFILDDKMTKQMWADYQQSLTIFPALITSLNSQVINVESLSSVHQHMTDMNQSKAKQLEILIQERDRLRQSAIDLQGMDLNVMR